MSIASERLVESWLDSQTERRYQPVFIQMLVSSGWEVLHNTRHSPIELGKDVIARSPDGELCAFQLKGNPGGRVTKSEAASLSTQIVELMDIPVPRSYGRKDSEEHVAIFVTNGEVDEEARLVFDGLSERCAAPGCPSSRLEIWSRGKFLSKLQKRADDFWPHGIESARGILNFLSQDGLDVLDVRQLILTLEGSTPPLPKSASAAKKNAYLTSCLLLGEILKSSWRQSENHFELFKASVLISVYAIQFADTKKRKQILKNYMATCLQHCTELLDEVVEKKFDPEWMWAERDPLSEFPIMAERANLIGTAFSALILADVPLSDEQRERAQKFVKHTCNHPNIWGEGAIPAYIVRFIARKRFDPTLRSELIFAFHIAQLARLSLFEDDPKRGLASPYYDFFDVWAERNGKSYLADRQFSLDTFQGRSRYALPMFLMLVRRNLKTHCKSTWQILTKLALDDVEFELSEFLSPAFAEHAENSTQILYTEQWNDVVSWSSSEVNPMFECFEEFPWLLAAYVSIVPYRGNNASIHWLDRKLSRTWY